MNPKMLIVVALVAVVVALFAWAVAKFQNASPAHPARRPAIGNINRRFHRAHMRKVYLASLLIHRFAAWLGLAREPRCGVQFANVGEGTRSTGAKMYFGDATTSARYLLYKIGSDGDHVALAGAGDTPLGPSDDMVGDVTVPIAIKLLGATQGTVRVVTDGSVANGNFLTTAANGQVTVGVTTNLIIGKALIGTDGTSAAGDVIEMIPILPGKHPF